MSDRRAARGRPAAAEAPFPPPPDLNDVEALALWVEARRAYSGSEPLPRMPALVRFALRHHGINWR